MMYDMHFTYLHTILYMLYVLTHCFMIMLFVTCEIECYNKLHSTISNILIPHLLHNLISPTIYPIFLSCSWHSFHQFPCSCTQFRIHGICNVIDIHWILVSNKVVDCHKAAGSLACQCMSSSGGTIRILNRRFKTPNIVSTTF